MRCSLLNERPKIRVDWRIDKGLNSDKKVALNFFIRYSGKTVKKGTGVFIKPKEWNNKKKTIVSNPTQKTKKDWNDLQIKIKAFDDYCFDVERIKGEVNWNDIEDFFLNRKLDSFFDFCDTFLSERILKPATKDKYVRNLKIFKEFCKTKKIDNLSFSRITVSLLSDFQVYLLNDRKMGLDSAFNYHKNFKTILKDAKSKGLIDRTPYEMGLEIKKSKGLPKIDPLTTEERKIVSEFVVPDEFPHLKRIQDYFVFMLNTGVRYCDFSKINVRDFKKREVKNFEGKKKSMYYLEIMQEKSNRLVEIPLNLTARALFFKYKVKNRSCKQGKVFPNITNQCLNRELKDLAKLAGINKNLKCHIGRHSFATNLRDIGVPLEDISELMGHSDIRMTRRYAKPSPARLVDAVSRL